MKTYLKVIVILTITALVYTSCQKEVSVEKGSSTNSFGSLQKDALGNCTGVTVSGTYYKDTIIKTSNYVDVTVTVDTVGTYTIKTDTINGYYFAATGTFTTTGTQTVRLICTGTPAAAGINIFTVTYNGTTCEFSVNVTIPVGSGATFTVSCTSPVINGTYLAGTALTAANTVILNVNVTATGPWNITTAPAVNGITFTGSGNFTTTGAQTITLTGSGTPIAGGSFNFPVTAGGSNCNFSVTCTRPPDYYPRTNFSNWSYQFDGIAADSLLIKVIPNTLTVAGNPYNIFMFTDNAALGFDTSGYYRKAGNDYYEWIDMGSYVGLDNPLWMENVFLKDNLTAGGTWNSSQFSGPFTPTGGTTITVTLRWEYSITGQNISSVVNGITYNNVIRVKQELKQLVGANWALAAYFDSYYALDKGLIKQDLYDNNNAKVYALDVRRLVVY